MFEGGKGADTALSNDAESLIDDDVMGSIHLWRRPTLPTLLQEKFPTLIISLCSRNAPQNADRIYMYV
jgi:hypothetical protein